MTRALEGAHHSEYQSVVKVLSRVQVPVPVAAAACTGDSDLHRYGLFPLTLFTIRSLFSQKFAVLCILLLAVQRGHGKRNMGFQRLPRVVPIRSGFPGLRNLFVFN